MTDSVHPQSHRSKPRAAHISRATTMQVHGCSAPCAQCLTFAANGESSCTQVETECTQVETECTQVETSCTQVETSCTQVETECTQVETECTKSAAGVVNDASRFTHSGEHSVRQASRTT